MAKKIYKTNYEYMSDIIYVLAKWFFVYVVVLLLLVIIDNLIYYFK